MIVPSSNDRPPQKGGAASSPPPDSALLMAAATMHQMGRLGPAVRGPTPPKPPGGPLPGYRSLKEQEELGKKVQPDYQPIDQLGLRG